MDEATLRVPTLLSQHHAGCERPHGARIGRDGMSHVSEPCKSPMPSEQLDTQLGIGDLHSTTEYLPIRASLEPRA